MSTQAVLRHRRDTAANWTTNNPILEAGQVGFETDTLFWKFGDGITAWTALLYPVFSPGALNDLTNVIETAPVAGQLLEYNGTNWVNVTPAAAVYVAPAIVTDATTALTAIPADANQYTRFTNAAAKAYTFTDVETYVVGSEFFGRNVGTADLTLTAGGTMVLNAPAGGTLVVPQGGSFAVKIVGASEADVTGYTVTV